MPTSTGAARTGAWVEGPLIARRHRSGTRPDYHGPRTPLGTEVSLTRAGDANAWLRPNKGRLAPCGSCGAGPSSACWSWRRSSPRTTVEAQFRRGFNRGFGNVRLSTPADVDGSFQFCRIIFNGGFGGDNQGGSWNVDWPRADINLSIRLSELTKTTVGMAGDGEPNHLLLRLTDEVLYQCPFIMMTEVGSAVDQRGRGREAARLPAQGRLPVGRRLLGRLRVAVVGSAAAPRAAGGPSIPIVELPSDHPLFHCQLPGAAHAADRLDQLLGRERRQHLGARRRQRRGPHARDPRRQGAHHGAEHAQHRPRRLVRARRRRPRYFRTMSVPGYSFGINVLVYAMTH